MLAARAARRIAESMRQTSGRAALAGDAEHLLPVVRSTPTRDVFEDPFAADEVADLRPALVVLDDGADSAAVREQRGRLTAAASEHGVRVETLSSAGGGEVARYASLLGQGRYASAYLGIAMGRAGAVVG